MHKVIFLISSLLIIVGSAYALFPSLFPDTSQFPRVPTGPGTIGSAITKILGITDLKGYLGDGTVTNSTNLAGRSATGYLKKDMSTCTQKYTGIDATGKGVCGSTPPILLADIGRIIAGSGSITVYRADGTSAIVSTFPYTVQQGDIIDTPVNGDATVRFSDDSILRLDSDTTLALDIGTDAGGMEIASVLLESGQVWGRILTLTGSYSIGTRDIVAGVRGTAINVEKKGATNVTLAYNSATSTWIPTITGTQSATDLTILDTTLPASVPIPVTCTTAGAVSLIAEQSVTSSAICAPASGGGPLIPLSINMSAPALSVSTAWTDPWKNKNTQKDLDYIESLLAISGSMSPSSMTLVGGSQKQMKLEAERNVTKPANAAEESALCNNQNERYYPGLGCAPAGLLAYADYTKGDTKFYNRNGTNGKTPINLIGTLEKSTDYIKNGFSVSGSTDAIEYNVNDIISLLLPGGILNGKTLRIELNDTNFSSQSASYTIFYNGSQALNYKTYGQAGFLTVQDYLDITKGQSYVEFKINGSMSQFKVGNSLNTPIKKTIKRIFLQN